MSEATGAGDRDRTGMASLEGWGSTIELHPRGQSFNRPEFRLSHYFYYNRTARSGRSVVASAPALGAGDREFESLRPDS